MKNIIYVSLIALILSGCKGSSFLTQRYTKFGHSPVAKRSESQKPVKAKVIKAEDNSEYTPVEIVTNVAVQSENKNESKLQTIYNAGKEKAIKFISSKPQQKEAITESSLKEDVLTQKDQNNLVKKITKKSDRWAAAKAIIGKVLKIIILILLIVVIGGLIVLITLLGAI